MPHFRLPRASLRLAALLLPLALALGLLLSERGLQLALSLIAGSGFEISAAQGRLIGPLRIDELHWRGQDGQEIAIAGLAIDWSPARLLHGELRIDILNIERLQFTPGSSQSNGVPRLELPLAVDLPQLAISGISLRDQPLASDLHARFVSDGQQHRLTELSAHIGEFALAASGQLDGRPDGLLAADLQLTESGKDPQLAFAVALHGPLAAIELEMQGKGRLGGHAEGTLTPFAKAPFRHLKIAVAGIDPQRWQAAWPQASLELAAHFTPAGDGVAGDFQLHNRHPGPLDRGQLALSDAQGQLSWQSERLAFDSLHLAIAGGGVLQGRGQWQDAVLSLALQASRLDAARLDSRLRSTQLSGPISAALGTERQQLELSLGDRQLQLSVAAEQDAARLRLKRFELTLGPSRLNAQGELAHSGPKQFAFAGDWQHLDPRLVLPGSGWPTADLNGHFSLQGQRQPDLGGEFSFTLNDSRIAGQALTGQGHGRWTGLTQLSGELQLSAGNNRLRADGAFGRPGDRVTLTVDAAELAKIGLDGSLQARAELAGTPRAWQLSGSASAPRLGLPGRLSGEDLRLAFALGGAPEAALELQVQARRLSLNPPQTELTRLSLIGNGQTRAHQIKLSADLPGKQHFDLGLDGGLDASGKELRWQGQLARLQWQDERAQALLALQAPGPLEISESRWRFGPWLLANGRQDWQARLSANADSRRLQASLAASGRQLGQIDGEFSAALRSAWQLEREAPWRGRLDGETPDLAWLADYLGGDWRVGGQLSSHFELSGTPAVPLSNGHFQGQGLALQQISQGFVLNSGQLQASLQNNRLRIETLKFRSPLQPLPRPLREALSEERVLLERLMREPGKLEITGEIAVDRKFAESASLEILLDHVGIAQRADQWLTLSGSAQAEWQEARLGVLGRIAADAGYWRFAPGGQPRLSDDVVIRRSNDSAPATGLRPRLDLDLGIDLGPHFHFSGAGLASRLEGEVRLHARERDLPRASGTIQARDGRFEAYGQKLVIERGELHFNGLLDNPGLDIRAVRKGLAVEPGVQIGGSARKPVVRLISDPELPDAEKLAWLVLGHGPESMGGGDAPLLLAAAGSLLGNDAGNLLGQIRKNFGVDEFGLRQGQIGDSGSRQPTSRVAASSIDSSNSTGNQILSIGKRLSNNALLSYEQALGKAESVVKLTVSLGRNLSLVGRAGSDNALDLFYTVLLGAPSSKP